jgi:hypothetical protein
MDKPYARRLSGLGEVLDGQDPRIGIQAAPAAVYQAVTCVNLHGGESKLSLVPNEPGPPRHRTELDCACTSRP